MAKKDTRKRNYATIVYPESAPDNWLDIISDEHVEAFVSPLHDQDVNPTGEPKKPHYHVMIMYEGNKSEEQVRAFTESFGGVGLQAISSLRGNARYLCHLDNPEKHQYDTRDVVSFAGADYMDKIGLASDKYNAIGEMMDFCRREHIYSLAALADYARMNQYDWFRIICDSGAFIMREYLKSLNWEDNAK